jgi:hypothetical protein
MRLLAGSEWPHWIAIVQASGEPSCPVPASGNYATVNVAEVSPAWLVLIGIANFILPEHFKRSVFFLGLVSMEAVITRVTVVSLWFFYSYCSDNHYRIYSGLVLVAQSVWLLRVIASPAPKNRASAFMLEMSASVIAARPVMSFQSVANSSGCTMYSSALDSGTWLVIVLVVICANVFTPV